MPLYDVKCSNGHVTEAFIRGGAEAMECGECGNDKYETAACVAGGGRAAGSPRECTTYTVCAPTYARVLVCSRGLIIVTLPCVLSSRLLLFVCCRRRVVLVL